MKNENSALDSILSQDNANEKIIKEKAALSIKIIEANKKLKTTKEELGALLIKKRVPTACLYGIKDKEIRLEIIEIIVDAKDLDQKKASPLIVVIAAALNMHRENAIVEQKLKGVHDGLIITELPADYKGLCSILKDTF